MTDKMPVFEVPTGVTTWVPGTNLKECLRVAIDMWIEENHLEVVAFLRQMKEKRDMLNKNNGMSRQGHMKEYLEVPAKMGLLIGQMTHKDWMLDRQITDAVKRLIPDLSPYKGKDESKIVVDKVITL